MLKDRTPCLPIYHYPHCIGYGWQYSQSTPACRPRKWIILYSWSIVFSCMCGFFCGFIFVYWYLKRLSKIRATRPSRPCWVLKTITDKIRMSLKWLRKLPPSDCLSLEGWVLNHLTVNPNIDPNHWAGHPTRSSRGHPIQHHAGPAPTQVQANASLDSKGMGRLRVLFFRGLCISWCPQPNTPGGQKVRYGCLKAADGQHGH